MPIEWEIEWENKKGTRLSSIKPIVSIYIHGILRINRTALLMIREKIGDLMEIEIGYDYKRNCVALKPVKQKTINSFPVNSGYVYCGAFLKRHKLVSDKILRCELTPEEDYYIFFPNKKLA